MKKTSTLLQSTSASTSNSSTTFGPSARTMAFLRQFSRAYFVGSKSTKLQGVVLN